MSRGGKSSARPASQGIELHEINSMVSDEEAGLRRAPPSRAAPRAPRAKLGRHRSATIELQQKVAQDQREQVLLTIENTISKVMRRQFIREFIPYLMLLALVIAITLIDPTDNRFHMDAAAREKFLDEEFDVLDSHIRKNFKDVRSMDEFWQWVQGPLQGGLFDDTWYNDDPIDLDNINYLNHASRLIGTLRFRQHRVMAKKCQYQVPGPTWGQFCYPEFGRDKEDRTPFGPADDPNRYTWAPDLSLEIRSTYSNVLYNGNGYATDIVLTPESFNRTITQLKTDRWIDEQTRAVFINFNVYNGNLDLFGSIMLVIEFLPSGDVGVDTSRLRFIPRMSYSAPKEIVALILDACILSMLVFLAVREISYMTIQKDQPLFISAESGGSGDLGALSMNQNKTHRIWNAAYFKTFWNYLSWVNIATFLASYIAKILWMAKPTRINLAHDPAYLARTDVYFDLEIVGEVMSIADALWAINIIFTALQFFKYIRLNKQMSLVWEVVALAMPQFLVLSVTLLVVVGSFSLAYYVVYGKVIHAFRNPAISVSTCIQMLFGDFDYEPLTFVNRYLTPLFFWIYIALSNLLLLNLFIAVISLAYETVVARKPSDDETVDYGIVDAVHKNVKRMLTCNWARSKDKRLRSEETRAILITHSESGRQLEEQVHNTDELENEIRRVMVERNMLTFAGPISVAEIEEALSDWIAPVDGLKDLKTIGKRVKTTQKSKLTLKDVAGGRGRTTSGDTIEGLDPAAMRTLETNIAAINENINYMHAYFDRRMAALSQEMSAVRVDFTQLMLKMDRMLENGVAMASGSMAGGDGGGGASATARRTTLGRRTTTSSARGRQTSVAAVAQHDHSMNHDGRTSITFGGVKYRALGNGM